MHSPRALKFERLYEVAERQQGFFAALQARELGYSRQLQSYHVSAGDWIKKGRGIFRLKYFPPAPWSDGFYMTYLWALNRDGQSEGVFGYGTALYLHNLSTYVPPVFDLIVPKHFRRHSEPPGTIQLYKQNMDRDQIQMIAGLPVTRALKTVIDLLDAKAIDYDYVLDALRTAIERFAITDKQMRSAKLTAAQKERLMAALKRINHELVDEIR